MGRRILLPIFAAFALSCSDPTGPKADEILAVVSGNAFSCALAGENAYCWGKNDLGQLGRGVVGDDAGVALVSGTHHFRLIAASDRTACGVTVADSVFCWGHGRILGALSTVTYATPTLITGTFPAGITSIGIGYSHGCVTATNSGITCFGTNALGELGNGNLLPAMGALGATPVIGGHAFSQISVGAFHTCGVETGKVWCWGTNFSASFGPGAASRAFSTPTQLALTFDATRVEAGSAVTCALDATSQTRCWGSNVAGQLGRGAGSASSFSADPVLVSQSSIYASLSLSRLNSTVSHSCGIASTSKAFCWGASDESQLGRAATETCAVGTVAAECGPTPTVITSDLAFKQLAPGRDHTCGLTTGGDIYCWGSDARKQLGGTVAGGSTTTTAVRLIIKG